MRSPDRPAEQPDVQRYKRNLAAERDGAALYRALAAAERDAGRRQILLELAQAEERHAALWLEKLRAAGVEPGPYQPGVRIRLLAQLAKLLGTGAVLPVVQAQEGDDAAAYVGQPGAQALAREERSHARVFAALARTGGADIAGAERWHRRGAGGSLRAAVFGINDGLVSNFSLVMGVAGAAVSGSTVLLAGLAGLLAGAFSMAAGEYVSVRSQREMFENQIAMEREELQVAPEDERKELVLIYRAKGVPEPEAERVASLLLSDPQVALDTLAREELGLDPEDLGIPLGAAISSFVAFAAGAILPVLPYLFLETVAAFATSAVLSGLALFGVGAMLSLFTGRSALASGARMLLIGGAAALVTFLVGRLLGVAVAG